MSEFNLSDVLGATTVNFFGSRRVDSPVIVSGNHDASSINWVAGMSDPGEMIGCGMYQELRRMNGEKDDAYQTRLIALLANLPANVRQKIETAGRKAGTARANIDQSNGRMNVFSTKAMWHGLGTVVTGALNSDQAIQLAGLSWQVLKLAYGYTDPVTRQNRLSKEAFAIVRADTGDELGSVGGRYTPIQNSEAFAFLDDVLGDFGAKFHTAGSLFGGRKIWAQVALPEHNFRVTKNDETECFATLMNPHDGSGVCLTFPTANRVVCNNTLRVAMKDAKDGIKIRHSGNVKTKIESAKIVLGLTAQAMDGYKDNAQLMVGASIGNEKKYFNEVLDAVLNITQLEMSQDVKTVVNGRLVPGGEVDRILAIDDIRRDLETKQVLRDIKARSATLEDILERYESETNGIDGIRGTVWSAYNSVTESADHGLLNGRYTGNANDKASRRFESVLSGKADDVKQVAYQSAMSLLA